jgi:hypothetical protein
MMSGVTDHGPPPPAPSRVNYRRVALISLGALAVAGAATVGVLQLLPRGHEAATPAGTPTPSAAETSAETTPSGSAGLSAAPPGTTPGTLVYLTHTGGGPLAVTTVSAGTPRTTAFGAARGRRVRRRRRAGRHEGRGDFAVGSEHAETR